MKLFNSKYSWGLLALLWFCVGVVDAVHGVWWGAALMWALAIYFVRQFDKARAREQAPPEVVDVPLPEYDTQTDILRKGYEPVETPTDFDTAKVRADWQAHMDGCTICRKFYKNGVQ